MKITINRSLMTTIATDYIRYINRDDRTIKKCSFLEFIKLLFIAITGKNHSFTYSFWWRLTTKDNILKPIARFMHYRLSRSYGIQIPTSTKIGPGLYLGHGIAIVINGETTIGSFCNISHFVSIGTNNKTPAIIGDNVYIGPNVSLLKM